MATKVATATAQPAAQPAQLCDYCKQKPKFSNFQYCSKTCANQAATLCNQCHKKPKFQNFEYCGKNCASLANSAKGAGAPQAQAGGAPRGQKYPKGNNFNAQKQNQPGAAAGAIDPLQIAKLVVQHIPQVQAMLAGGNTGATQPGGIASIVPASTSTMLSHPIVNSAIQATQAATSSGAPNGSLGLTNTVPAAQPNTASSQQAAAADDLECLIPGCGKPVHVDSKGLKASDYCSMRHREEAVVSGLAPACIMCLALPQSDSDYFCSAICREDALNKEADMTQ
jgi:hypothetical protein